MKKYINPEMRIFDVAEQDILTLSGLAEKGRAVEIKYDELFPQ